MTDQGSLDLPIPRSRPRFPAEPIIRSAEIEDNYRWTLRRAWGAGPAILWCMLNPSTADDKRDDPTMMRVIGFSYRWGFGSAIVVNVYPFISANTDALWRWRRDVDHSSHEAWVRNVYIVGAQMEQVDVRVAAWGAGADDRDLSDFLEHARPRVDTSEHDGFGRVSVGVEWQCLGRNGDGSPKHPLARGAYRVPDDAVLQTWRSL